MNAMIALCNCIYNTWSMKMSGIQMLSALLQMKIWWHKCENLMLPNTVIYKLQMSSDKINTRRYLSLLVKFDVLLEIGVIGITV